MSRIVFFAAVASVLVAIAVGAAPPAGTYNTITTTTDCNGKQTVTYENIPANGPGITRNNNNNCNSGDGATTNNNNNNGVAMAGMTTTNNNNNGVSSGGVTNNNMNGPQDGTVNNNNNGPQQGGTVNNNNNGPTPPTAAGAGQPQPPPAGTYNTITTITDCVTGTRVEYTMEPGNGPCCTRNNINTCNAPGSNTITNNNG